jgi:hypothetical protein
MSSHPQCLGQIHRRRHWRRLLRSFAPHCPWTIGPLRPRNETVCGAKPSGGYGDYVGTAQPDQKRTGLSGLTVAGLARAKWRVVDVEVSDGEGYSGVRIVAVDLQAITEDEDSTFDYLLRKYGHIPTKEIPVARRGRIRGTDRHHSQLQSEAGEQTLGGKNHHGHWPVTFQDLIPQSICQRPIDRPAPAQATLMANHNGCGGIWGPCYGE